MPRTRRDLDDSRYYRRREPDGPFTATLKIVGAIMLVLFCAWFLLVLGCGTLIGLGAAAAEMDKPAVRSTR